MNDFDIDEILRALSTKRPIFHNEADFQFTFAWEIQKRRPDFEIRLEYNVPGFDKRYTNIYIKKQNPIAIELKYKSKSIKIEKDGEIFELRKHGASDQGRYDFLKDVQRLEEIVTKYPKSKGYAIMITNDSSYWTSSQKLNSIDAAFKIHEGQSVNGDLSWSPETGTSSKKNREKPIILKGTYKINWKKYSSLDDEYGEFRILCLQITSS